MSSLPPTYNPPPLYDNAPKPFIAAPAAQLDASRPDIPVSTAFDDIYFNVDKGLEEIRQMYLRACGLPERWAEARWEEGRTRFCIGELGFGAGLNFLTVWQMWRAHRPSSSAQLYYAAIEGFPLSRDQLISALARWDELSELAAQLIDVWPDRVKGQHIIELPDGITLILCHDAVQPALERLDIQADCWFLDGFSPAKNPDMWSAPVMERIFERSAPGAKIGTFTVAVHVQRSLAQAGFDVSKQLGFGRRRERIEAVKPLTSEPLRPEPLTSEPLTSEPLTSAPLTSAPLASEPLASRPLTSEPLRPLIIGAGIGGASLARSFLKLGVTPIIIDADDGSMASANPAAIVKPRLDLQDRPESRFFLSAYLYALGAYNAVPSAIISRGIAHSARHSEELARFEKLCAQASLPAWQMDMMSAESIGASCGLRPKSAGLWFERALAFDPNIMRAAFMTGATQIKARIDKVQRADGLWQAIDAAGKVIAQGAPLILAGGAGLAPLLTRCALAVPDDLVYLRGQVTWACGADGAGGAEAAGGADGSRGAGEALSGGLTGALTYGGYAIAKGDMLLLGASHGRTDEADLKAISVDENRQNLDAFHAATGEAGFALSDPKLQARAAMRVSGFKTLPRMGRIRGGQLMTADGPDRADDLHILTGLGGRGFSFAPLMAAHMATRLCGGPSFLAQDARMRLNLD